MPSVHMPAYNCYLYFIYKEILEAHWNTSLHHLVLFLFISNIPVAERRVVLMLCIFFQSMPIFSNVMKIILFMSVESLEKVIECQYLMQILISID